MQKSTNPRNVSFFQAGFVAYNAAACLSLVIDRILKYIVEKKLPNEEFFIIPRLLSLILHQNHGMAFSIAVPIAVVAIIGFIVLLVLLISGLYSLKIKRLDWFTPIALIFIGGASNLFDRVAYGYTIDYLHLWPYSFFNIADLLIISGCILAIFKLKPRNTHGE